MPVPERAPSSNLLNSSSASCRLLKDTQQLYLQAFAVKLRTFFQRASAHRKRCRSGRDGLGCGSQGFNSARYIIRMNRSKASKAFSSIFFQGHLAGHQYTSLCFGVFRCMSPQGSGEFPLHPLGHPFGVVPPGHPLGDRSDRKRAAPKAEGGRRDARARRCWAMQEGLEVKIVKSAGLVSSFPSNDESRKQGTLAGQRLSCTGSCGPFLGSLQAQQTNSKSISATSCSA